MCLCSEIKLREVAEAFVSEQTSVIKDLQAKLDQANT